MAATQGEQERHNVPARDAVAAAFGVFDADGDGFISSAEPAECLSRVENTLDVGSVADLMAVADRDGDGLIGQQDFFELLMGGGGGGAGSGDVARDGSYTEDEEVEAHNAPLPAGGGSAAAVVPAVPVGDLHKACSRGDEAAVDAVLRRCSGPGELRADQQARTRTGHGGWGGIG